MKRNGTTAAAVTTTVAHPDIRGSSASPLSSASDAQYAHPERRLFVCRAELIGLATGGVAVLKAINLTYDASTEVS
jgi:hypothetical protein